VTRQNIGRAEAFFRAQDWGMIAGMTARVAHHQNHQRLLCTPQGTVFHAVYVPLQFMGPYEAISGRTSTTFMVRQRVANVTVRPESRGYIGITE
jgi:hypothetical protein